MHSSRHIYQELQRPLLFGPVRELVSECRPIFAWNRVFMFFFFNDTATTEIYTLSLHDALPIWLVPVPPVSKWPAPWPCSFGPTRSEERTSALQSRRELVCRLLLQKKKGPR